MSKISNLNAFVHTWNISIVFTIRWPQHNKELELDVVPNHLVHLSGVFHCKRLFFTLHTHPPSLASLNLSSVDEKLMLTNTWFCTGKRTNWCWPTPTHIIVLFFSEPGDHMQIAWWHFFSIFMSWSTWMFFSKKKWKDDKKECSFSLFSF